MHKIALSLLISCCVIASNAQAASLSDKINQAMKSDVRSDKDKQRDSNRRPAQTLEFFGIKDNMQVLELIPGGGWYTKLLAPTLAEKGKLYVGIASEKLTSNLLTQPPFKAVVTVSDDAKWNKSPNGGYDIANLNFEVKDIDAVLTFRNYHNLSAKTRAELNEKAMNALKPGGIYGVVDHTRRHMEPDNKDNGRRMDPVLVIKEVQAAGFELVDYTSLHYKSADELRHEVGHDSITGQTDRFALLFKKPLN